MRRHLYEWLQNKSEKEIYPIIEDLLEAMGYSKVRTTHGPREFGRDVVFFKLDELKRPFWRGVQVKVKDLSGSLATDSGVRYELVQCQTALETKYKNDGQEFYLQEMWLVTTKRLTEEARESAAGLLAREQRIRLVSGNDLCELLDDYLPDLLETGSARVAGYLDVLIAHCDSVEEYLTVRLRQRFALSEVFVQPHAVVSIAKPSNVGALVPLHEYLGLDDLLRQMSFYKSLLQSGLVPEITYYRIKESLRSANKLLRAAASMGCDVDDVAAAQDAVNTLADWVDFRQRDDWEWVANKTQPDRTSGISAELLRKAERALLNRDSPAVNPIKAYMKLMQSSSVSECELDPRFANLHKGRNRFYSDLEDAYKTCVLVTDPLSELVLEVAEFLRYKYGNKVRTNKSVTRAQQTIVAFAVRIDTLCRQQLDKQWARLPSDLGAMATEKQLEIVDSDITRELVQVTSLLLDVYGADEIECVALQFDAMSLCKVASRIVVKASLGCGKTTLLKQLRIPLIMIAQSGDCDHAFDGS